MSTQNIRNFITAAGDVSYLYEERDIDRIAPRLLETLSPDIHENTKYIGAIGRGNIGSDADLLEYSRSKIHNALNEAQLLQNVNKFVGLYNTGGNHWISFIIYRTHDSQSISQAQASSQDQDALQGSIAAHSTSYMVWFKDSLGMECKDFQDDMKSILGLDNSIINIFSFSGRDQILEFEPYDTTVGTHIHTNCGIFALRNMIVLASKTPLELTPDMQGFFLQDLRNAGLHLSLIEQKHNYELIIKAARIELPKFYIEHGGEISEGEVLSSGTMTSTLHTIQNSPLASTLVSSSQLSNAQTQEPILLDFFDTKLTLEDIKLKREIAKLQMVQATEIAQLQQIEVKLYAPLIKKLAYTKSPEELQVLSEIFEDLGSLTVKLVEFSGSTQEKLKHYTDAAVLYQYILTMLDEKSGLSHIDEVYINKREVVYNKLARIKSAMMSVVSGLSSDVEASLQSIKSEIDSHKAMFNSLRKHAEIKVDEIEDYRILSQSASNHEILEQLQVFYVNKARVLFHNIAKSLKGFLATLYQEAEKELKAIGITKPCDYAVIGLGSLALKQATPYSDLEFAIITENNAYMHDIDSKIREYFRSLTHLVHFKMINLEETVIPTSKYGLDMSHIVHRGVNFDLGGKTPLGRIEKDKPYDLIGTKEWLMHYVRNQGEKASHIDKNLPYILENVTHVYGNESLTKDYQEEVTKFLSNEVTFIVNDRGEVIATEEALLTSEAEPYMVEGYLRLFAPDVEEDHIRKITMHHCEVRALKILKEGVTEVDYININKLSPSRAHHISGDLGKLDPLSGEEGKIFDVKQEVYRLPDRLIYSLGLYYGIQGKSGWDIVSQMQASGIFNEQAATNLEYAVTFACTLRLKTYLHNKGQREDMSLFFTQSEQNQEQQIVQVLHLSREDLQENGGLFRYFYTALSLHKKLEEFCNQHNVTDYNPFSFFKSDLFYSSDSAHKGLIHYRLAQYKEAQIALEDAISYQENKDNLHIRIVLGCIYGRFGFEDKAIAQYQYCVDYYSATSADNTHQHGIYDAVADSLYNIGIAHSSKGNFDESIKYLLQSLRLRHDIYTDDLHADIVSVLNTIGRVFMTNGKYDEAIQYLTRSLKLNYTMYKDNLHIDIATSLHNLGQWHMLSNNTEAAIAYYLQSLEIMRKAYKGEPHPDIAASLNNLGSVCNIRGEFDKAIEYYTQSLKIRRIIYTDESHPDIAASLNNLGAVYRAQGNYDESIKCHLHSFEILHKIHEYTPHADTAASLNNLGLVYRAKGNYDEAIKYCVKALEMQKILYKDVQQQHQDITTSLNNLGVIYREQGQYNKAIDYYFQSLNIMYKIYGNKVHADIAETLNNIGIVCVDKGNFDEAIKYYIQALEMQKILYKGMLHPDIAVSLNNIGVAYKELGDYDKAIKYHLQGLELKQQIYKDKPHASVTSSLDDIGSIYYLSQSNYTEAIKYYIKALEMKQVLYGNTTHPEIATSLNNLGVVYKAKGDYDEAIKYHTQSLEMRRAIYKDKPHPHIASSLNNLGLAYASQGRYDEAITHYIQSLEIRQKIYNYTPHPNIAASLNNLGTAYEAKDDHDMAINYYVQALKIQKLIYKAKPHPDIAGTLNNLGLVYAAKGDYDAAIKYYTYAVEIQRVVYKGGVHTDIAGTLNNLGLASVAIGNYDEAVEYYDQSLEIKNKIYGDEPHPDTAISLNGLSIAYRTVKNFNKAIVFGAKALQIINSCQESQYQNIIQNELIQTAIAFAQHHSLNVQNIVDKIFTFATGGQDFIDYTAHYALAVSLQAGDTSDLDQIIEEYRLALVFIPKVNRDDTHSAIESAIYNNLAIVVGTSKRYIEFWCAASNGDRDLTDELLVSGQMDVNISIQGVTPLINTIIRGDINIISKLIQAGVDINKANSDGATPLYCALGYYGQPINLDIVALLLHNNAYPNQPMNDGDTPMHMAYYRANIDAIKLLLQYGANLNAQNHTGKTPLHCLLEKSDVSTEDKIKIVEEFLPKYDLAMQDQEGKTVMDYAAEHCLEAPFALLRDIPRNQENADQEFLVNSVYVDLSLIEPYMLMGYFGLGHSNETIY